MDWWRFTDPPNTHSYFHICAFICIYSSYILFTTHIYACIYKHMYNIYTYGLFTHLLLLLSFTIIYIYIWAPVKILYIWVVDTVMVIAFGEPYRFPGFCGNHHIDAYWRSNMKPESTPKRARKWIEELFCRLQVLRQHFMFLSFCIHLHASSFTFLSLACIFLSFCIHFL